MRMTFDALLCSHGESALQLRTLINSIFLQRTKDFRLGKILLCSDNEKMASFGELAAVEFVLQPSRLGKADALNRLLKERESELSVQNSADCVPASDLTYRYLLQPFCNISVGAVTSRPEPVNAGFMGLPYIVWRMHPFVQPKITGELFAFRSDLVKEIPADVVHDDTFMHQVIMDLGYDVVYEPRAVVLNRVPETLREYYAQRKKNVVGNLQFSQKFGTLPPDKMRFRSLIAMGIELLANVHGRLDYARGKVPKGLVGYSLPSTKEVNSRE